MPSGSSNRQSHSAIGWEQFITGLDKRMAQVSDAWDKTRESQGDSKSLTILHHRLHNLGASAQGFRLENLSEKAKKAEKLTMGYLLRGKAVLEKELETLHSILEGVFSEAQGLMQTGAGPGNEMVLARYNPSLLFVVDDDLGHREHLSEQLRLYGYQVQAFGNLRDMRLGIQNARPDAMIVDLSPPISDLECIDEIQTIQAGLRRPCPLIFVSNEDGMDIRFAAVKANATAFFTRPIRLERLVERLDILTAQPAETPLRALVVDDDEAVARLHADLLVSAGMQLQILTEPERLLPVLAKFKPELVLMDVFMPNYNGVDLVRMMRQHESFNQIPVVYLSSEQDEKQQIQAIRSGGDDFITKPVQPSHLISSVMHLARRYRQALSSIHFDPLTGLFNHTRIRDELRKALGKCQINGGPLSLALLRVENLEELNDRHGDAVGDQVLRGLAHLLHQQHSPSTPIGRYGGSSFMLLLPGLGSDQARPHLQGLVEKLHAIKHQADDVEFGVQLSVGLASSPPAADFAALTKAARDALGHARKQTEACLAVTSCD